MSEVQRKANLVWLKDSEGRVFGAHVVKETGDVMFTTPTGQPGVVNRVAEVPRDEARTFARELLALVGEHDQ